MASRVAWSSIAINPWRLEMVHNLVDLVASVAVLARGQDLGTGEPSLSHGL